MKHTKKKMVDLALPPRKPHKPTESVSCGTTSSGLLYVIGVSKAEEGVVMENIFDEITVNIFPNLMKITHP